MKHITFFLLLSFYFQNALAGWPKVPEAPQSTYKKMAEEIFVNGVPVSITLFISRLSPRQVLSFYRSRWSGHYAESETGPWQQISQMNDKFLITIQVQDDDKGSHGRVNVTKLLKKIKKIGEVLPMMPDSKVLNEVITKDKFTVSTMLLLKNKNSVDDNVEFYKNYFSDDEWKQVMSKNTIGQGAALVYKNESDEISITIKTISGVSTIVLNKVIKRDWFN